MRFAAWLLPVLLLMAPEYRESIGNWRAEREARLTAEDGWLTLTGLFWLREGASPAGSAETAAVRLPAGFPAEAGVFHRSGMTVRWNGKRLKTDKSGDPDIVRIGRLRLHVIERGSKLGVRIKDDESAARRNFQGLRWFPVRHEWNVRARFVPQPKQMVFDAQAGDKQRMSSPGYVEWEHNGRKLRLTPVTEDSQLWFIFRDRTAGKTTYGAARFLYADPPKDGYVNLDFNKAYNPPCVFTPYATCPLPPPENRLDVAVEAGEMMYAGHP